MNTLALGASESAVVHLIAGCVIAVVSVLLGLGWGRRRARLEREELSRQHDRQIREAVEALRVRESRLVEVLDRADCLIWRSSVRRVGSKVEWLGFHIPASALHRRLFGTEDSSGTRFLWSRVNAPDLEAMSMRSTRAILENEAGYEQEFRVLHEGRLIWLHEQVSIAPSGPDTCDLVGVIVDITARREAEEAFHKHDARYRLYVETAPEAIIVADAAGLLVEVNASACRMTGYPRAELLGLGIPDLVPPGSVGAAFERFAALQATGVIEAETTVRRKDGLEIQVFIKAITMDDGRFLGFCSDITEQRRKETERQHLNERLTYALRAGKFGVWDWDLITGQLEWDDQMYLIYGVPRERFGGAYDAWRATVHPDDLPRTEEELQDAIAGRGEFDAEFRVIWPSGEVRRISARAWIRRDATGRALQVVGLNADITLRDLAEEALRKNQDLLNAMGGIAKVGGWEFDLVSNRLSWTDEVRRIHQVEPDYVPDVATAISFYTPESRPIIARVVRRAIEHGEPYDLELEIVTAKGATVPVRSQGRVVMQSGKVVRLIGAFQDISDRKQADAERDRLQSQLLQSQKMESVGRLAGGVAHDFNNMLQVILGNTDFALHDLPSDHPKYELLVEIRKAAHRSAQLTNQLLAFARKQAAAPRVIHVNESVVASLSLLGRLIGEDIELIWQPGDNLWPIRMDPSQLDQILANLVVNARDAIRATGKITIKTANVSFDETHASTHPDSAAGDYVLLTVTDTGIGMDAEMLAHIFEPFFTTKEVGQGTGLGLATVFGIVKQNRGLIQVSSEPGVGSTFRIWLPKSGAATEESPTEAAGPQAGGPEVLLLVEDEEQVLSLANKVLRRHGYTVLTASTPQMALKVVSQHQNPIQLLITDVVMPGMNGRDLYAQLRVTRPEMKCLFMSGYTADVVTKHGIVHEGINFIQKPFSIQTLTEAVRRVLDN